MTHTFRQTIDGIEYEVTTEPGPDAQGPYLPDGTYSPITTSKILSCRMVNDADWQRERTRLQAIADTERESVLARRQVARSVERRALLVAAVVIVGAVLVALTGCGSQEAPIEPVSVVQDEASPSAQPAAVETKTEPPAAVGDTAEPAEGVTVYVVQGSAPRTYAVQFQASPSFAGEWAVPVSAFTGVDSEGQSHAVTSSQWPQNATVSSSASIMGGTLTFDAPITELVYAASDGSTFSWSVS